MLGFEKVQSLLEDCCRKAFVLYGLLKQCFAHPKESGKTLAVYVPVAGGDTRRRFKQPK